MKISYSWIKELVDVKLPPESLAEKLSMAGLSVELLEQAGDDWVYHIEITSNRPDWLSAEGIAQEISAVTGAKLNRVKRPASKKKNTAGKVVFSKAKPEITIDDKSGCLFYYGNLIEGVKVGPSPAWLQKRLEVLGMRPVNNIVDITNYCLLETGQPLHAFDFAKIADNKITVRRARKQETIDLLDKTKKNLDERILVIADEVGPIAAAGVMGGSRTEVTEATTAVLLESAFFNPIQVRRSSRILGVSTDSSYRFERGVDFSTVLRAHKKATEMIMELAGGRLVCFVKAGKVPNEGTKKIRFNLNEAVDMLGMDISESRAKTIFKKLGFSVRHLSGNNLLVGVPAKRRDVRIKEDLCEELVRVLGYENIPLTSPSIKPFFMQSSLLGCLETGIKNLLVRTGLKEVVTYSLIGDSEYQKTSLEPNKSVFELENYLSRDYRMLRNTLVPSLLNCASLNVNRNNKDFEFFEISRVFSRAQDSCEGLNVGIVLCGDKRSCWQNESVPYDFFDLKGILESVFERFGVGDFEFRSSETISFADGGVAAEVVVGGDLGVLFCK